MVGGLSLGEEKLRQCIPELYADTLTAH
jgi:hypothetical protein